MTSPDPIDEMRHYYDRRAPWHDSYMSYSSLEEMIAYFQPVIDIISPLISGQSVLEIACGTGNWTQILAMHAKAVTATDSSPQSLALAVQKIAKFSNVQLELADAYALEKLERKFAVAFAADWYCHIPKSSIPRFLERLRSTLCPNATVIFLDILLHPALEKEFARFDHEGNRIDKRRLPDGSTFEVIKNFPTEEELRNELSEYAGDLKCYELTELKRRLVKIRMK